MITPKLNINGSSAQDLIEPRQRAWKQIDDLVDTLQQITPNGRDYPDGVMDCITDIDEHYDRLSMLRALQAELLHEALAIKEQED
jgi:hypothetical protein